jgi:organic hydroperoxide reductase OsmC/OhrA
MQKFPHHYRASAAGAVDGEVELTAEGLPLLRSASPAEFDGPGDRWSPETLLVASVADCFLLTFRAVARASTLAWTSLHCEVAGTLDRIDGATQFTHFKVHAHLAVPEGTDPDRARRALDKAERGCLISNSLKAQLDFEGDVEVAAVAVSVS